MRSIGLAIYAACVDFMIHAANLFGMTYRDANALLFFLVWPAVTIALLVIVLMQRRTLKRLQALDDAPDAGRDRSPPLH